MSLPSITEALLAEFGPDVCLTESHDIARWCVDFWGLHQGSAAAVLRPRTTEAVAAMVAFCASRQVAVVPQGGNTGVMGGAIPDFSGQQVVISVARLNRIREIDSTNFTATVEAGCILAEVQKVVAAADRLFPLSFGAEGSCQIGGALATNAGGSNVARYGNARDLVLGLEVVLADGRVWHGLRKLRKDNTGYDLKHLFMGSEGTLGIITAAVIKLFPRPRTMATALLTLADLDAATALLGLARDSMGETLSALELIPRRAVEIVSRHATDAALPPEPTRDWFALIEFASTQTGTALDEQVQSFLEMALDAGHIVDASVAANIAQRGKMWLLRESIAEAQMRHGAVVYFDVAVAVSDAPEFIRQASAALRQIDPCVDVNAFGHVGDGNIHYNLLQPEGVSSATFLARKHEYESVVYAIVQQFNGSISAEHGVGIAKARALHHVKSDVEMDLMRRIRGAISQEHLNPDKVVTAP